MAGTPAATRVGLSPDRATRLFLLLLAAAVVVVVLLSLETDPAATAEPGTDGTELLIEQARSERADDRAQGPREGTPPSPPPGQPDGPGNACNTAAAQHNPHCEPS